MIVNFRIKDPIGALRKARRGDRKSAEHRLTQMQFLQKGRRGQEPMWGHDIFGLRLITGAKTKEELKTLIRNINSALNWDIVTSTKLSRFFEQSSWTALHLEGVAKTEAHPLHEIRIPAHRIHITFEPSIIEIQVLPTATFSQLTVSAAIRKGIFPPQQIFHLVSEEDDRTHNVSIEPESSTGIQSCTPIDILVRALGEASFDGYQLRFSEDPTPLKTNAPMPYQVQPRELVLLKQSEKALLYEILRGLKHYREQTIQTLGGYLRKKYSFSTILTKILQATQYSDTNPLNRIGNLNRLVNIFTRTLDDKTYNKLAKEIRNQWRQSGKDKETLARIIVVQLIFSRIFEIEEISRILLDEANK